MATNDDPEAQEVCLMCKHTPDEAAEDIGFHRIDGLFWHICDGCVRLLSDWKEEASFMLLVSDRLDEDHQAEIREVYEGVCEELGVDSTQPYLRNATGTDVFPPEAGDGP